MGVVRGAMTKRQGDNRLYSSALLHFCGTSHVQSTPPWSCAGAKFGANVLQGMSVLRFLPCTPPNTNGWTVKIMLWKRNYLSTTRIFGVHVSLQICMVWHHPSHQLTTTCYRYEIARKQRQSMYKIWYSRHHYLQQLKINCCDHSKTECTPLLAWATIRMQFLHLVENQILEWDPPIPSYSSIQPHRKFKFPLSWTSRVTSFIWNWNHNVEFVSIHPKDSGGFCTILRSFTLPATSEKTLGPVMFQKQSPQTPSSCHPTIQLYQTIFQYILWIPILRSRNTPAIPSPSPLAGARFARLAALLR